MANKDSPRCGTIYEDGDGVGEHGRGGWMGGGGKEMVTTTMRGAVIRVRAGVTVAVGVGGCKGE